MVTFEGHARFALSSEKSQFSTALWAPFRLLFFVRLKTSFNQDFGVVKKEKDILING